MAWLWWLGNGCICGLGTTSIRVSSSRTLILLSQIPRDLLLLLLCNTKPTRALSIVHPRTFRVTLIYGTYRDSRISWLRLLLLLLLMVVVVAVDARRGRGRPLVMSGMKRGHRGRSHGADQGLTLRTRHAFSFP